MNLLIALLYYFRQGAKVIKDGIVSNTIAGNLDPFYLLAPLYLVKNFKDMKKMKKIFIILGSMILLSIIHIIFNDGISLFKIFINVSKIIVCVMGMFYVIENYKKIDILKITKLASVLFAISIPIAFIFNQSSTLWRLNDIHNKYDLRRLHLFFLEPSELGFHVAILIIILVGYMFSVKDKKEKQILGILILTNSIVLYLAKPLGAIVLLAFSLGIMLLLDLIYRPSKFKIRFYSILALVALIIITIMIINKTPIVMRIFDTLNGTDSSNSYRIGLTMDVFKKSFRDYKGRGVGFGNLNTENFIDKYRYLGLVVVVTNSFFYFAIESGILGILVLFGFIALMFKKCLKDRSLIKFGLFTFLILYQIFAGHFTSGLTWVLYGVILSDFNEF